MRTIRKIIYHCSDSDHSHHDNMESFYRWHVTERGWSDVGYHFVIMKDGSIQAGRPIHKRGAHAGETEHSEDQNHDSIGICLTGKHEFSDEQFETARVLTRELCFQYGLMNGQVFGHRDFNSRKTCPNFPIEKVLGL